MQGLCSGVGAKKAADATSTRCAGPPGLGSKWHQPLGCIRFKKCSCLRLLGKGWRLIWLVFLLGCWQRSCIAVSPLCPSARAEERSSQGVLVCRRTHQLGALTGRSCLSGARQRAASSAARPASEHHRLPVGAAEGTRAVGSPSFAYFSWRSKKSESPAGARPGKHWAIPISGKEILYFGFNNGR